MRCLERNKRGFWYALFDHVEMNEGDTYNVYKSPVHAMGNISAATGETQAAMFGNSPDYDRVIVIDELDCPIDENSVMWIDKDPPYDTQTQKYISDGWDYIVKRVAKPLDSVSYAVKKVDVS